MPNKLKKIIDNITLYSAALSFYTIFSLIPIILIMLTIFANSPFFTEFYTKLEHFIATNILPTNQEAIQKYLASFLQNSSKMGIIGILYILITSILFFDNYETIISKICEQPKRNLWEKIKLYWTMITLFPIMFASAMFLSIKVQLFLNINNSNLIEAKIASFIITWLTFLLAYQLTLYTPKFKYSLTSSFIVTIIFFISKNAFIYYVISNKTYTTIYGSISILMFTFLWIYINWIIYLSGIYFIKYLGIISEKKESLWILLKLNRVILKKR
jgi:membrane protein